MEPLPPVSEEGYSRRQSYRLDGEETVPEALIAAFSSAGIDPDRRDTTLYRWIEPDELGTLLEGQRPDVRVTTVIWEYPVVIRPDVIRIYRWNRASASGLAPEGEARQQV